MGLHQNMVNEPVSQLTLREPVLCSEEETVRTAIERMRERRLGCVVIADEDRKPLGIFTESMLTQLLAKGVSPLDDPIGTHMSEQWPRVKQSDPIIDVLEAMEERNIRFICVIDDEGRLVALTGQKGLMEYVADHFPGQVMVQRVGCAPYLNREGA